MLQPIEQPSANSRSTECAILLIIKFTSFSIFSVFRLVRTHLHIPWLLTTLPVYWISQSHDQGRQGLFHARNGTEARQLLGLRHPPSHYLHW